MEPRDCAARNRDERKRKQLACEDGTRPIDELGHGRHAQRRKHEQDRHAQYEDRADFHERRQVVARRQEQPDRQDRRDEAVDNYRPCEVRARPREGGRPRRTLGDPLAAHERGKQQRDSHHRGLGDLPWPDVVHPKAHEQGDRDRARDSEKAPRAVAQRVDDDEREHGEQDDHDRKDRDHRGQAGNGIDLFLRDLPERFAVASHRRAQDQEVLHRSAQHNTSDEPQRARQEPELRGEGWTDQRAGARNGRKVVAEEHPLRRDDEVATVRQPLGGRCTARVEAKDSVGDEARVEPIGYQVGAHCRDQQPRGVDRLAARERNETKGAPAGNGDGKPDDGGHTRRHRCVGGSAGRLSH